jgi:hypothetical protein
MTKEIAQMLPDKEKINKNRFLISVVTVISVVTALLKILVSNMINPMIHKYLVFENCFFSDSLSVWEFTLFDNFLGINHIKIRIMESVKATSQES